MKRNTLSIPGCPNYQANLIFAGRNSEAITCGALINPNLQKVYCIKFGEA